MNASANVFDITIIGAGPTGLFGAFYAGMREMSCKVIDVLPQAGGQVTALYPEKLIYDTPGFPGIVGKELIENLMQQASRWDTAFALGEQAQSLERVPCPDGEAGEMCWAIGTSAGKHYSRAVIIAAGIGAFRPVKLKNESIDRFEDKGVVYFVRDIEEYASKRLLIVGGGDSAVDWALATEPIAEQVTLIHRREGFRSHDISVNRLMESKVDVRIYYELRELQGNEHLERAVIFDNRTDEDLTIVHCAQLHLRPAGDLNLEIKMDFIMGTPPSAPAPGPTVSVPERPIHIEFDVRVFFRDVQVHLLLGFFNLLFRPSCNRFQGGQSNLLSLVSHNPDRSENIINDQMIFTLGILKSQDFFDFSGLFNLSGESETRQHNR